MVDKFILFVSAFIIGCFATNFIAGSFVTLNANHCAIGLHWPTWTSLRYSILDGWHYLTTFKGGCTE